MSMSIFTKSHCIVVKKKQTCLIDSASEIASFLAMTKFPYEV